MQRLICLALPGQPAAELIDGAARIWTEKLGWMGAERLNSAFDKIEEEAARWPTPASIRKAAPPKVKLEPKCQRCGWDFDADNKKKHPYNYTKTEVRYRSDPRTCIAIRKDDCVIIRCDKCYEQELWHAGKHPKQTYPEAALELYRAGLFA